MGAMPCPDDSRSVSRAAETDPYGCRAFAEPFLGAFSAPGRCPLTRLLYITIIDLQKARR
jgi:hypothetical protein